MNYTKLLRVKYDTYTNEFETSIHAMTETEKQYRSLHDYSTWIVPKNLIGVVQYYKSINPEYYEVYNESDDMQIKMAVSKMADALEFDLTCKIKNLETQRKELAEAIRKYREEN